MLQLKQRIFREFFPKKWRHVPCIMTSSIIHSPSILNIWRHGGLTALEQGPEVQYQCKKNMQLWFIPPIQQLINQQYLNTWWHIQMSIIGEVHAPVILTLKPVSN